MAKESYGEPRNPVTVRPGFGWEKYPLTEAEKAAQAATRKGGHAKFLRRTKYTDGLVRAFDATVAQVDVCRRCQTRFVDYWGDQVCDSCASHPCQLHADGHHVYDRVGSVTRNAYCRCGLAKA